MLGGTFQPQGGLLPVEAGGQSIVVSDASLLFGGNYHRAGDDLQIRDGQGSGLLIQDYFAQEAPPPLMSAAGAALAPELVAKLAAAHTPVQIAQVGPVGDVPAIGQVEDVTGTARAFRGGRPLDLSPGDPVFQNDVVETGLVSELVIGFADGTIFSLGANARMLLDALVYDPAGSSNELGVSILQGVFSFVTGQIAPTGEMLVETPVATLGIRGTTVHGVLQSIAGPLTVFLGSRQQGTEARVALLDPLSRGGLATLVDLNAAYFVSALGAPPQQRPQSAAERQFTLDRAGVIHDVQSSFGFRYDTGEPIDQPGETLRTQAGPNQPSGGIGYDRASGPGEALQGGLLEGLDKSPTLALLDALPFRFLGRDDPTNPFFSVAVSASVQVVEASTTLGFSTSSTGQTVLTGGLASVRSFALAGLSLTGPGAPQVLTSGGIPVNIVQNGTEALGFAAGVQVFSFQLNGDGSFTFNLLRPLDHPIAGATGAADTIQIRFDILVTFIDGSVEQTAVVSNVLDSGPMATHDTGALSEAGDLGVPVAGNLPIQGGGDGVKSVAVLGLVAPLTSGGQAVSLVQIANDTFVGATSGGTEVFRLIFDSATGAYTYTQSQPIDHSRAGADSQNVVFRVAVTDGDNDTVISTISITVVDSVPSTGANAQASVQESALADGSGGGTTVASGVLSFVTGADGGRIVAVTLGGQAGVLQGNDLVITGAFFELRVDTLGGAYTYTLTDSTLAHAAGDPFVQSFSYFVRDGDGDTTVGVLDVRVDDDGPSAQDDTESVSAGAKEIGNVVTGVGTTSGLVGADGVGADGIQVTGVAAGAIAGTVNGGVGAAIETALGFLTLDADGSYVYVAKANVSGTDTFTYTITDGDGDSATATLSVSVDASQPTVAPAIAQVSEAGLDAGDVAPGDDLGSDPTGASESTGSLNLVFSDPDDPVRVTSVTFGATGVAVPADNADVSLAGSFGTLTIRADGTYSYALFDNADHSAGPVFESFDYTVGDGFGNTSSSTITVEILDDAAMVGANAPVSVQESALEDGSGGGATVAAGALSFVAGADGARIVALSLNGQAGVLQGNDLVIADAFFMLRVDTLSGAYTYTLTDNTLAHAAGDPLVQRFDYTVRDGDGDTAVGVLEVRVDDDGPSAQNDSNTVAEGDSDGDGTANQASGNVILGADALSADLAGADGPLRVTQVSFSGASVAVPSDNSDIMIAGTYGALTIRADGTYTYTAPKTGTIHANQMETFGYTVVDGDGDLSTATLAITLLDSPDLLGAFLLTNTNQKDQTLRIIVTRDDAEVIASNETDRPKTGQEPAVLLGDDGVFVEPDHSYALILKFASHYGSVNVTDFHLIFDLDAPELDAPSNIFLTLHDQGTIHLGTQCRDADGVIWQVEGTTLTVGPAILYDISTAPILGDVIIFDSAKPGTGFTLDLGLLPTAGNSDSDTALFGEIEALDLTGSQGEANTLVVHAQDILDIADAEIQLAILGGRDDTVVVADLQNWRDGDPSTAALDPVRSDANVPGSWETFDVYQTLAGAELFVDDDLIVQAQLDPLLG